MLVKDVERLVDIGQETLNLVALMRPGISVQTLDQSLLSRKKACRRRHLKGCCEGQFPVP
jgi:hypothetical protein